MRRRDFLSGAAVGAAALSIGWPAARAGLWRVATSLPASHPALAALQAALPLQLVPRGAPAETELALATRFAAGRPALAILAALPFGPTPDRLVPWLRSDAGAALWRQAAGSALLPVWAAPGAAPRFAGSDLLVLRFAVAPDETWRTAALQALAGAAHGAAQPVTATVARINAGNRAAAMVQRLAAKGDPLTRTCLSAMQELAVQCSTAACHHPLMELAG